MQNKIDLHIHMDGSLPEKTINKLAEKNYKVLNSREKELFEQGRLFNILFATHCNSLPEYLEHFELPCRLLQTPESIEIAFEDLAEELANQGLYYAEIRFSPQFHSTKVSNADKLGWEDKIIESAIKGINKVTSKRNIVINIILCCMRNLVSGYDGRNANMRTVFLARKYLNKGVCAIDLAGPEARDATEKFSSVFLKAKELEIPFTLHAGESGSLEWLIYSLNSAIKFEPSRISHAVGLAYIPELQNVIRNKGIAVECCLKSDLDTKAIRKLSDHPIKKLFDLGIHTILNTGSMTVSNTNLEKECLLAQSIGFSGDEIEKMQEYALSSAFMTDDQRKRVEMLLK